jgi:hypothetical protein
MPRPAALALAALALLAGCAAAALPEEQRSLVIHPNEAVQDFTVPRRHSALGIEFLNHEIYGGLSTQMLFGESFEEAPLSDQARCLRVRMQRSLPGGC